MLEYDDDRSGTFAALKDIPEDKFIVLGLITTKTGRLERMDDLRQRVTTASKYFPLAQLGVSTQCGFASSVLGTRSRLKNRSKSSNSSSGLRVRFGDKGPSSLRAVEIDVGPSGFDALIVCLLATIQTPVHQFGVVGSLFLIFHVFARPTFLKIIRN